MKAIFWPAVQLMLRLPNERKLPVVSSVQRANELIGQIATASAEQSTGVGEINNAIVQLERVTQENAALVEAAAASSLSCQEEADRLTEVVARFRIAGEAAPAPQRAG